LEQVNNNGGGMTVETRYPTMHGSGFRVTHRMTSVNNGRTYMSDQSKKSEDDNHRIDPVVPEAIGKQLKRIYDKVADEPVPDRFSALLDQLAKQEQDKK